MKPHRLNQIRTEVKELLNQFGVTRAPINVEGIATSIGIQIRRTPTDDEVSGFLYKQAGMAVIGVNALHHPNRQRFTIAHELGHYRLHNFDEVHVDQFIMKLRNDDSSKGEHAEEIEANRFAAELLMPEDILRQEVSRIGVRDLSDDRAMQQLAKQFQVSMQAMSNRLTSLGCIPAGY